MGGGSIYNSLCSSTLSSSSNQIKSKTISLSSKKRNNNLNNRNNNGGSRSTKPFFCSNSNSNNLKSLVISLLVIFMMFCSFFLPSSFIYAISSPVRNMGEMYPLSLVDEGSALAGIKGFEYEYGYLPTSDWIGLVSDLSKMGVCTFLCVNHLSPFIIQMPLNLQNILLIVPLFDPNATYA